MDDEWFIRVHTDVTQCLIPVIQNANKFSPTLMNSVQILCLDELYSFAQKYVNGEMKRLENLQLINKKISRRTSLRAKRNELLETLQPLQENIVYLCKTISTCMKLRCLPVKISNLDKNESVDVLKQLEDHVLSLVQNMIKHLAQVSLESYFEKCDEHIYNLTEEIEKLCESLPQTQAAEEIRTIIGNLACNCVSRVYLDCLMKINFKKLQRRWGNVEERIRQDVQNLHDKFSHLNVDVEQNQLLMRMSEVLFYCDVETLKFTCGTLFKDFPEDSEQYLPRLLRWKKTLSEQQVKEILDVGQMGCQNPACDSRPQPLMDLCCCLGF
ncbi:uncharacterized protein [Paramisgurnus dabryanus]|uniref:uncharacterized protein n=1 Tax=Paramisgurnus dabryanus TaxID=90735 RepID=UPI003CCF7516